MSNTGKLYHTGDEPHFTHPSIFSHAHSPINVLRTYIFLSWYISIAPCDVQIKVEKGKRVAIMSNCD